MSTIAERVAAGAAFLDEHDPDWWRPDVERAIDLDALDLAHGGRCVLGQRCPLEPQLNYSAYAVFGLALFGTKDTDDLWELAAAYGFTWPDEDYGSPVDRPWDDLTAEWKRVITERRALVTA